MTDLLTTEEYKAVAASLELPQNASPALVGFMSNMNKLAEASIVARGGR